MISELHCVAGKSDEEGRKDLIRVGCPYITLELFLGMCRYDQGLYRPAADRYSLSAA